MKKESFQEVESSIEELMASRELTIVGISGFGGSGKTELAKRLKDAFANSRLLQLDNFIVNRAQGEGWNGGYDWDRFESVLRDVREGKDLKYFFYDWEKDELSGPIEEPLPKLLIAEGVRLLQPQLVNYFDLSVWIDMPIETASRQGIARDRKDGADDAHLAEWEKTWIPKDLEYEKLFKPREIADVLYQS